MPHHKIYIPNVPKKRFTGELKNILVTGVLNHPDVESIDDASTADLILLDFRHLVHNLYQITEPQKTVITDYRDYADAFFPDPALLYFKRSITKPGHDGFVPSKRSYSHIAYCLRQEYLHLAEGSNSERDIDIAVFFEPLESVANPRNKYRTNVARHIKQHYSHLKLFVGVTGARGQDGRSQFQSDYAEMLLRARIIVTCNPDRWEGDWRLFEALGSGAAVLVDQMQTPIKYPFSDGEHLLYYDRTNLNTLTEKLNDLLDNEEKRKKLACQAYRYVHTHHKPSDRIQQILEEVEAVKGSYN